LPCIFCTFQGIGIEISGNKWELHKFRISVLYFTMLPVVL
jgi:hypothetical protein